MTSKYSVELFMEACNATGPLQLSMLDATRTEPLRRVFHQPFVVIGRNPTTDLMLDHWRVSRRHAYLQIVMGRLFCIDLGSRTGTEWDDGTKGPGWLNPDRSIVVGPYEISRWQDADRDEQADARRLALPTDDDQEDDPGTCTIEYRDQVRRYTPVALGRGLTLVGSANECRVRLPFPDVSKTHCSLIRSDGGVWVVDLLGRGGTFVNESHVRFARLDDGDELRIGRHTLRLDLSRSSGTSNRAVSQGRAIVKTQIPTTPARVVRSTTGSVPPSSTMPMISNWRYPEHQVQRTLGDRQLGQTEMVQALMQPMVEQFGQMQQQMFEQFHQAMMAMFQTLGAAHREQMNELREEIDEVRRITQELQALQEESARGEVTTTTTMTTMTTTTAPAPSPPAGASPDVRPTDPGADFSVRRPTSTTSPDANAHRALFDRMLTLQNERQTRWQKILGRLNRS